MLTRAYSLRLFIIWSLLLCTSTNQTHAQTTILNLALLPPENASYRRANEAVKIKFPFNIVNNISSQLALELDSVDISSMVEIDNDLVIFNPPTPLVPGFHQMRLVEYAANGDIVELGNWSFEIRQSAAFREQQLNLGVSINNHYLIASDYSDGEPDINEYSSDGSANLQYNAQNENLAVNFTGDLLYVEAEENSPRGEQVDLGQYLLGIDVGKRAHFDLGHHAINHNSLIYSDFHRRGISGQFTLPSANTSLQLFSSRTGDLQGFTRGFGIEDSNNRTSGATLDIQPFSTNPESLTFSVAYVNGKRADSDATFGMLVEESSGNASMFALDSQLFDNSLRLRLEAAQSEFGFEGLEKERDKAYRVITQYATQAMSDSEQPLFWDMSLEKRVVEPNFYSFANSQLATDSDLIQFNNTINKGAWSSQLSLGYEEDNLDKRFNSTIETSSATFVIQHSQTTLANNSYSLLGLPTYRFTHSMNKQNQNGIELDEFLSPLPENDNKTQYSELIGEFVYESGSWSLLFSHNELEYNAAIQPNSEIQEITFAGSLNLNSLHSTGITISSRETKEDQTKLKADETLFQWHLQSSFESLAINTYFSMDYIRLTDEISGPPTTKTDTFSFTSTIAKKLREAKGLFPGIDLALKGSYRDINDNSETGLDSDFYEVFLDLNFYWDINRPAFVENQ